MLKQQVDYLFQDRGEHAGYVEFTVGIEEFLILATDVFWIVRLE